MGETPKGLDLLQNTAPDLDDRVGAEAAEKLRSLANLFQDALDLLKDYKAADYRKSKMEPAREAIEKCVALANREITDPKYPWRPEDQLRDQAFAYMGLVENMTRPGTPLWDSLEGSGKYIKEIKIAEFQRMMLEALKSFEAFMQRENLESVESIPKKAA